MGMTTVLDSYGQPINIHSNDVDVDVVKPKLSKNALRKHKRYGVPITFVDSYKEPKKLDAVAKGKGILNEYYHYFDSHNISMNPRTHLIRNGY